MCEVMKWVFSKGFMGRDFGVNFVSVFGTDLSKYGSSLPTAGYIGPFLVSNEIELTGGGHSPDMYCYSSQT